MDYEALQNAVVTRLEPFTTVGISVIRLPEKESENVALDAKKSRFTIIYAGSEYGGSLSTAEVSQDEKIFIQVLIESAFLYGDKGIYKLISLVKQALTGFKALGSHRFTVVKHHTLASPEAEKKNNIWNYHVVFQTTVPHVEDFTEDLSVILKQIRYNDQDGETMVVPPTE